MTSRSNDWINDWALGPWGRVLGGNDWALGVGRAHGIGLEVMGLDKEIGGGGRQGWASRAVQGAEPLAGSAGRGMGGGMGAGHLAGLGRAGLVRGVLCCDVLLCHAGLAWSGLFFGLAG